MKDDKEFHAYLEQENQNKDFNKQVLSKNDFELFREENHTVNTVFRVKYFCVGKVEKWKCYKDNKQIFIIEASKLLKKEVAFIKTVEGFNFLLNECKAGATSFSDFKKKIKEKMKEGY